MSKATLTFTDNAEKGTVDVHLQFDPAVTKDTKSAAQLMAAKAITMLQQTHANDGLKTKKEDL